MTDFSEMFEKIFKEKELLKNEKITGSEDLFKNNINILRNMQKIFDQMTENEKNAELILALKPLLSEKLQKKADESINLLKIFSIMPFLKEKGILN